VHTIITSTSREIGAILGILLCPGRNIVLLTRCALVEAVYSQYKLGLTLNYMYMPQKRARMGRHAEKSQANSFSHASHWELIKNEAWLMS